MSNIQNKLPQGGRAEGPESPSVNTDCPLDSGGRVKNSMMKTPKSTGAGGNEVHTSVELTQGDSKDKVYPGITEEKSIGTSKSIGEEKEKMEGQKIEKISPDIWLEETLSNKKGDILKIPETEAFRRRDSLKRTPPRRKSGGENEFENFYSPVGSFTDNGSTGTKSRDSTATPMPEWEGPLYRLAYDIGSKDGLNKTLMEENHRTSKRGRGTLSEDDCDDASETEGGRDRTNSLPKNTPLQGTGNR